MLLTSTVRSSSSSCAASCVTSAVINSTLELIGDDVLLARYMTDVCRQLVDGVQAVELPW